VHGISHTNVFRNVWVVVDAVNKCPASPYYQLAATCLREPPRHVHGLRGDACVAQSRLKASGLHFRVMDLIILGVLRSLGFFVRTRARQPAFFSLEPTRVLEYTVSTNNHLLVMAILAS
jgi:hypothetical protein